MDLLSYLTCTLLPLIANVKQSVYLLLLLLLFIFNSSVDLSFSTPPCGRQFSILFKLY